MSILEINKFLDPNGGSETDIEEGVKMLSDGNGSREEMENTVNYKVVVEKYKNKVVEFICSKYNWDYVVDRKDEGV